MFLHACFGHLHLFCELSLLVLSAFCVVMLTLMWLSFEGLRVCYFTKNKKELNGYVAACQRGDSVTSGFGVRESVMVPLHPSLAKCAQHLPDDPKIFNSFFANSGVMCVIKVRPRFSPDSPFTSFVNLGHVASPL